MRPARLLTCTAGLFTGLFARDVAADVGDFGIPPLERAPTTTIAERGETDYHYRGNRPIVAGIVRHGLGVDLRMPLGPVDGKAVFGYDLMAGARLGLGRGEQVLALWPEVGWTYIGSGGHFLSAGMGPAIQSTPKKDALFGAASYGIIPRFLYGSYRESKATGFRVSAMLELLSSGSIGLEVAYGYLFSERDDTHEIRFALSSGFLFGRTPRTGE